MTNETSPNPNATPGSDHGLRDFFLVMLGLIALRLVIGTVSIPVAAVVPASLLVSIVFVAAPIYALFRASSIRWTWGKAALFLVGGLIVWSTGPLLAGGLKSSPFAMGLVVGISQQAIVGWCLAIGAMIALLLKDRNLLLPVAIFLALFDLWLVFAPEGVVNQTVVKGSGQALQAIGYQIPKPQTVATGGYAAPMAYVGPADYLFLAMFFVALFRFDMRTRKTFQVSVPVLAIYLLVVLLFGWVSLGPIRLGALPALVPIGAVVLIVNRKEFKLSKDELQATVALAVLGSAFVTWRIFASPPPAPRPETSPSVTAPADPGSPPRPATSGPGRSPSEPPPVRGSTPSPP